jgi:hypothetical protein
LRKTATPDAPPWGSYAFDGEREIVPILTSRYCLAEAKIDPERSLDEASDQPLTQCFSIPLVLEISLDATRSAVIPGTGHLFLLEVVSRRWVAKYGGPEGGARATVADSFNERTLAR